ncbi:LysR family transcriptional regulator [Parvibaculum sp.]|uniref:LysR family transcriptional regulator n=1 Tax=Parvibaculum sp. TaxID=2024848 RepID=UPI003C73130C
MPDVLLDLRFLKYAILASEQSSIRRASELLGVSQSTVTRRIQILERKIGFRIFERSSQGVKVTPAGSRFLQDAKVSSDKLHEVASCVKLDGALLWEIKLGISSSLSQGVIPELISRFRSLRPNAILEIHEGDESQNIRGVMSGHLDLAFVSGRPEVAGCGTYTISEEPLYIALPITHPLASRERLEWNEIKGETYLIGRNGRGEAATDLLTRKLSEFGFRPTFQFHNVGRENLINLVRLGMGVVPTGQSTTGIEYPDIAFVRVGDGNEKLPLSAMWSNINTNPLLRGFVSTLKQTCIR